MPTDIPTNVTGNRPAVLAETRPKDSKSVDRKRIQIIMEFLQGCSPYESDALRAMLAIASGKATVESMPPYDRTALNRYLNFGCDKETGGMDGIRAHRQARALELMKSVSQYVDKEDIINITSVLLTVSSDRKDIENTVNSLPRMQPSGNPQNAVNISGNGTAPK